RPLAPCPAEALPSLPAIVHGMAFAVLGRALWLPPLLVFASALLIGSLAFAIANLDRGQETLPPPFPPPGGGANIPPSSEAGLRFQLAWRILIASIFILGFIAAVIARVTKQKTVSVWELLGYLFGVGVIGGLVTFWPAIVAGLQSLALPGGSTRPGDP